MFPLRAANKAIRDMFLRKPQYKNSLCNNSVNETIFFVAHRISQLHHISTTHHIRNEQKKIQFETESK